MEKLCDRAQIIILPKIMFFDGLRIEDGFVIKDREEKQRGIGCAVCAMAGEYPLESPEGSTSARQPSWTHMNKIA